MFLKVHFVLSSQSKTLHMSILHIASLSLTNILCSLSRSFIHLIDQVDKGNIVQRYAPAV